MNRRKKIFWTLVVELGVAAFQPGTLLACAACYGKSDSPMAQGMNWGIFTLLGFILSVLTAVALFFVHVGRRTASLPPAGSSQPPKN